MGMARPPLPLGTYGKIRSKRLPGKGGWRALAQYRDLDGVTRQIERTAATKAKAENALREAMRDREHEIGFGEAITPATKVSVIAEAWFEEVRGKGLSPKTLELHRGRLDNQVLPQLGNLRGRELRTPILDRRVNEAKRKHGASVARTTRTVLSGICGYAARKGALSAEVGNPVRDVSRVSVKPQRRPRALSLPEVRQLRALLTYDDQAIARDVPDLVDALLATGQRIGDALALTADAFDPTLGTIEIRGTVIRLTGHGLAIKPEPKTLDGFRKLLLPTWAADQFRRRFAAHSPTAMDDAGLPTRHAADQLGHSKVSMTSDTYFGRKIARTEAARVLAAMDHT